nr:immunoglobulin heavy chain junction region [Macaca mulatta]
CARAGGAYSYDFDYW